MTRRELLEEAKCHWATAAAIVGMLAAGASTYAQARSASAAKKNALRKSAGETAGGGPGGYSPSAKAFATPLESGVDNTKKISQLFSEKPPEMSLGLQPSMLDTKAPEPGQATRDVPPQTQMSVFKGSDSQLLNPNQPQQPPPEQEKVPYDQYASLASAAAQIGQMLSQHGGGGPSPIPQATMGPYTPTADYLRRRGGF